MEGAYWTDQPERIVEAKAITKYFGALAANSSISLGLDKGVVHAILGENGSGKSTFAKILAGALRPSSGELHIRGMPVEIRNPRDGMRHGVGMVQQHPSLIPELTLAENCLYGYSDQAHWRLKPEPVLSELDHIGEELGFDLLPRSRVGNFSIGQRQRGEILRLLRRNAEVLIFDEPTDVLTPQEGEQLYETLVKLVRKGKCVLFITHRLSEVFDAADIVTVFRDGELVRTVPVAETSKAELVNLMLGRSYAPPVRDGSRSEHQTPLLVADALVPAAARTISQISLELRRGEILGIAGVEGNGQEELGALIAGTIDTHSGSLRLEGDEISSLDAAERRGCGVAYIPSDRQREGLVLGFSLAENLHLREFAAGKLSRAAAWRMNHAAVKDRARHLISEFDIRCRSVSQPLNELSGGNRQKVILARELSGNLRLIIASQPTRGLDIAARAFVHRKLIDQSERGAGVLLISSDLDEVLTLSDRVVVMARGKLMREFRGPTFDPMQIGHLMTSGEAVE